MTERTKTIIKIDLIALIISFVWILGIVISKGFWSAFAAVFFPPYAFYLSIEYFFNSYISSNACF